MALALVAGIGLAAAGAGVAVPPDAVAVVNGQSLSRSEFARSLVRSLGRASMESVVDRALVEQEARRLGVKISQEELAHRRELEIELRMRKMRRLVRLGPEEFRFFAEKQGWELEKLRREMADSISESALKTRLLAEKILAERVEVTEKDLKDYYERTRGKRLVVSHILVADRRTAENLRQRLAENLDDWSDLMYQFTLDHESRPYGGRLPMLPAASEFGEALAGLEQDALRMHRSSRGWHVLRLLAVVPAQETFELAREEVRRELLIELVGRNIDGWLAELVAGADVVVNLSSDPRERLILGADAAAFVNARAVSLADFGEALIEEFGPSMIEAYVERALIFQVAERRGVTVPREAVQERIRQAVQQLIEHETAGKGMTAEQFEDSLVENGIDPARYRKQLRAEFIDEKDIHATLLAEQMVGQDVEVSPRDIERAYGRLRKERVDVMEIVTDSSTAAGRICRRIAQGASFELLLQTESQSAGRWMDKGVVRDITAEHPYYAYLEDVNEGEVAPPFRLNGKYHILKVLKRRVLQDLPPLDSLRESLRESVLREKVQRRIRAWLEKLKAEATIAIGL